jgi:LmbE family N-acetylglucosaminyl deacetylase
MNNSLFISPHNDDAVLYGSYTLMRNHPVVLTVTDSYIQQNRGENITPKQRRMEDVSAMLTIGCPIIFAGIHDDTITPEQVANLFASFVGFDPIYIPDVQGGNKDHDLIGEIGRNLFPEAIVYMTYSQTEPYTEGTQEITPTDSEFRLKKTLLECYQSQKNLATTKQYFDGVITGRSEWYL